MNSGFSFFGVALQRLRVLRVGRPLSVPQATPVFQTSRCSVALGARSRRERRYVSLTLWTTLHRLRARYLDVQPPSWIGRLQQWTAEERRRGARRL